MFMAWKLLLGDEGLGFSVGHQVVRGLVPEPKTLNRKAAKWLGISRGLQV